MMMALCTCWSCLPDVLCFNCQAGSLIPEITVILLTQ